MTDIPVPTFHPSPSKPKLRLPAGAWDTHCHVFGPQKRFPYVAGRPAPADAPKEKLFTLHAHIGIERCVIVHTSNHGFDTRATEDALNAKGGSYRGIALAPVSVSDEDMQRLDALGFTGVRFHYMGHLAKGDSIEDVIAFAPRLARLGWHLEIHMESGLIASMEPHLRRSAVPVVIDHMGRIDAGLGVGQPAFEHLLELMRDDRFWVKVSGCDRASRAGPPYADAVPFARALVAEFPDRCVWGTDWPHPNHAPPVPDDGALVDLIAEIAPTEAQRQKLLVDNPRRLYATKSAPN
jgi:2-pyrone-4,6-dicarboxylate lactonase